MNPLAIYENACQTHKHVKIHEDNHKSENANENDGEWIYKTKIQYHDLSCDRYCCC